MLLLRLLRVNVHVCLITVPRHRPLLLVKDLPLGTAALDYVLDKARENNPLVTLEQGRQALGALGITDTMALLNIGALVGLSVVSQSVVKGTGGQRDWYDA